MNSTMALDGTACVEEDLAGSASLSFTYYVLLNGGYNYLGESHASHESGGVLRAQLPATSGSNDVNVMCRICDELDSCATCLGKTRVSKPTITTQSIK